MTEPSGSLTCWKAFDTPKTITDVPFAYRELQAQEALQNGQLGGGGGIPDLQPGVLASQAMIEKILGEDPRWQGSSATATEGGQG